MNCYVRRGIPRRTFDGGIVRHGSRFGLAKFGLFGYFLSGHHAQHGAVGLLACRDFRPLLPGGQYFHLQLIDVVLSGLRMLDDGGDFADGVVQYTGSQLADGPASYASFDQAAVRRFSARGIAAMIPH